LVASETEKATQKNANALVKTPEGYDKSAAASIIKTLKKGGTVGDVEHQAYLDKSRTYIAEINEKWEEEYSKPKEYIKERHNKHVNFEEPAQEGDKKEDVKKEVRMAATEKHGPHNKEWRYPFFKKEHDELAQKGKHALKEGKPAKSILKKRI